MSKTILRSAEHLTVTRDEAQRSIVAKLSMRKKNSVTVFMDLGSLPLVHDILL